MSAYGIGSRNSSNSAAASSSRLPLYADCAAHPEESDTLLTTADLYDRTGRTNRARAYRERALRLAEEIGGDRGNQLRDRARAALS